MKSLLLILILIVNFPCFASDRCSNVLVKHALYYETEVLSQFGRVGVGFLLSVPVASQWSVQLRRDAGLLQAGFNLNYSTDQNQIQYAQKIVDDFYHRRLKKLYPETKLTQEEVIDVLDEVNREGVANGFCDRIRLENNNVLETELFRNGSLEHYRKIKEEIELARKKRTEQIRSELTEDDETQPLLGV